MIKLVIDNDHHAYFEFDGLNDKLAFEGWLKLSREKAITANLATEDAEGHLRNYTDLCFSFAPIASSKRLAFINRPSSDSVTDIHKRQKLLSACYNDAESDK